MAKIIDLDAYNRVRIDDMFARPTASKISRDLINNTSNMLQFENKNGDTIVITPTELREYISHFLIDEINLYGDESVKLCREQLERRLDVQMSKIEEHLNDKIIKMTQEIISTTTSRLIQEEVNRRVDEKLRKIKKAIDESI